METNSQQKFQYDHISDCRSFGSNYHPCSQSRKISIGVIADSVAGKICKTKKGVEAVIETAEKVTSSKGNYMEDRNIGEGVAGTIMGKKTEAPEQETSPWVSTRSFHQNTPTSEAFHSAKQTSSLPTTSGMHNKFKGINAAATEHSLQFFANHVPTIQSADLKQKKFDRVTFTKKGGNELSFVNRSEVHVSEKEVVNDKINGTENRRMETLRMKLWDILGTVSSPKKQISDAQVPCDGADNLPLHLEQKINQEGISVAQPRQCSDTIESDTESPDITIKRPVTRSLTRTRAPTKVQLNKIVHVPSSSYKQKQLEKNIFSFEDGRPGKLHVAVKSGSSMSKNNKRERKRFRTGTRKICFSEKDNADGIQQATDRSKTTIRGEKYSSLGQKTFHSCPGKNNSEFVEPENVIEEKDFHQSPVMKMTDQLSDVNSPALPSHGKQLEDFANHSSVAKMTDQLSDINCPALPAHGKRLEDFYNPSSVMKMADQLSDVNSPALPAHGKWLEDFGNPSSKNIEDLQYDPQSPTFGTRTPIRSSSPSSSPRTIQRELNDHSPAERVFMEDIPSFKSFLTLKSDYNKTNVEMDSSEDGLEVENSPAMKSVPIMGKKDAQNRLLKSSSDEVDSDSTEETSSIREGCRETDSMFPEAGTDEKPEFVLRPTKRLCSRQGSEEINGSHGPSEPDQEDGLVSAVLLFASALDTVKSKMKSVTRKKSAEILMSVAEEIHWQLHTAESQIQSDMVKLTTLSKSKRKRIESRFQEQREQLNLIHDKFKEEVNQHIQDYRSTMEGLEAHQIEFKGTVEKQRTSHRKLLLQAEATMETQLNDAQRRITAVNKLAMEKMFQLKYAIAECLKEGILS